MKTVVLALVVAAIISVVVKLAVFTDDCNLVVMGVTFILSFVVAYVVIMLFSRLCRGSR